MLAIGKSLQEAAEAMRIKDQTARSYLKQIFLKTDTKRQAELVRLMLTSHLRIERSIEAASMQESG
jgi:DNA-binding CsgD family transcriptional regulator